MPFKHRAKIVRVGSHSEGVVLPKAWLDYYDLHHRDELIMLGNSIIIISPKQLEDKARQLIEQS